MDRKKWVFTIKADGNIEIEGLNFEGNQCVHDIIYQLIHTNALVNKETRTSNFGDEKETENVYYINN